ncbi:MAG: polysaccharide export protein [Gammaproteobacteria bacterium]|nr:polysaccharide export protein [Gammaproteobacteria bacterium]
MNTIFSRLLTFLVISAVLGACASGRPSYKASEISDTAADSQSSDYSIGPGDSLQIFVWDHVDLSTGVQVRPDGKISTPLVEDLQAAGRTPTQLARDIEGVLKEYVRTPVVTVIMQGFVGEGAQQIRVVGQAVSPMALQFKQGMTVLDVMIQVGGLAEFAAGNKARILRKTADGEVEIRVRLRDLLNDGDIEQNIEMMPGDVLIIPQSFF